MLGKVEDSDLEFQLHHVNSLETNLLIHVVAMTFFEPHIELSFQEKLPPPNSGGTAKPNRST